MKIKIEVKDKVDILGMFSIINGKVYAKYAECDFKNNNLLEYGGHATNKTNKNTIVRILFLGLLTTLEKLKMITKEQKFESIGHIQ